MFAFSVSLTVFGTTSSKVMLNRAITRTLRAPMAFFDTTPLGRITNRFSRDVDTMDNFLTDAIRMYFLTLGMIFATFALVIAYFHYVCPLNFAGWISEILTQYSSQSHSSRYPSSSYSPQDTTVPQPAR